MLIGNGRCRGLFSYLFINKLDIDKASDLHALALEIVLQDGAAAAHLLGTLNEELSPFGVGGIGRDGAVVALGHNGGLVGLDPTARLAHSVCVAEQGVPVGDAPEQVAHVHVVKGIGVECPHQVAVLDFAARMSVLKLVTPFVYTADAEPYKLRFGGTQEGWMGERSVPMTFAEGNSSAKSLQRKDVRTG